MTVTITVFWTPAKLEMVRLQIVTRMESQTVVILLRALSLTVMNPEYLIVAKSSQAQRWIATIMESRIHVTLRPVIGKTVTKTETWIVVRFLSELKRIVMEREFRILVKFFQELPKIVMGTWFRIVAI